ncbi:MAG: hypothetical protein U0401_18815 [Anaerolineae bacterium]
MFTSGDNFGQVARRAAQLAQQPGATPESVMASIETEFGRREFVTLRDKPQPYTMYGTAFTFAWVEEDWVIHRKGATPAGKDVAGLIPGSSLLPWPEKIE